MDTHSIASSRTKTPVDESNDDVFSNSLIFTSSRPKKKAHHVNSCSESHPVFKRLMPTVSSSPSDPAAHVKTQQTSKLVINSCSSDKLKFPLLRTRSFGSVSSSSTATLRSRKSRASWCYGSDSGEDLASIRQLKRKVSIMMRRRMLSQAQLEEARPQYSTVELISKFQYALRMVRFMVRLQLTLKHYSQNQEQEQTIDQLNYYSMETVFAAENQVFSKSFFAASNVVYMPTWARNFLSLPPQQRAQADVVRFSTLIKRFFTKNFLEDNLLYLCKHCTYERYEKRRVLIRSGHWPLYCYFLFSGSVFVNIQEDDKTSGRKYYHTTTVLKQGALFGEMDVIDKTPRTATIVARENIECLHISSEVSLKVFPEEREKDVKSCFSHMKKSDLFSDWPEDALRELCLVSKMSEYSYDHVIEKNTSESEFIYMVVKGRVEIMYRLNLSCDQMYASGDDFRSILPDHSFLPPMPVPNPRLLIRPSTHSARHTDHVILAVDSLDAYSCCDLKSLLKTSKAMPLILVSRNAEVIRFPKLRLQTILPLTYWKQLLLKIKLIPRYPDDKVLTRLYLEHAQWSAYKQIVLHNSLDQCRGRFQAMKSVSSKTVSRQSSTLRQIHTDDDGLEPKDYGLCLSSEAPLYDIKKHTHKGPCLRSWKNLSTGRLLGPRKMKRSYSMNTL